MPVVFGSFPAVAVAVAVAVVACSGVCAALETQPRPQHELTFPHNSLHWDIGGSARDAGGRVVFSPQRRKLPGHVWNKPAFPHASWELTVDFSMHGEVALGTGEGMAVWYVVDEVALGSEDGDVYGHKGAFFGLGVFFDTYSPENDDPQPYVVAMVNNGTQGVGKGGSQLGHCFVEYRNQPTPVNARIAYDRDGGHLVVSLDLFHNNTYRTCVRQHGLLLPPNGRFGVSVGDIGTDFEVNRLVATQWKFEEPQKKAAQAQTEEFETHAHFHRLSRKLGGFKERITAISGQFGKQIATLLNGHLRELEDHTGRLKATLKGNHERQRRGFGGMTTEARGMLATLEAITSALSDLPPLPRVASPNVVALQRTAESCARDSHRGLATGLQMDEIVNELLDTQAKLRPDLAASLDDLDQLVDNNCTKQAPMELLLGATLVGVLLGGLLASSLASQGGRRRHVL